MDDVEYLSHSFVYGGGINTFDFLRIISLNIYIHSRITDDIHKLLCSLFNQLVDFISHKVVMMS